MKIKLFIAYDGTAYSGWQVQKNAPTVQQTLQDGIEALLGKRYSVTGCSRTDSGVHANCFCCSVSLDGDEVTVPADRLPIAINRFLPEDVAVLSAEYTDDTFHPRYDVKYKEYRYVIWNSPVRNPFLKDKVFCYPKLLNTDIMDKAAKCFVGRYDFASFMASGSSVTDTVREIKYFDVQREGDKVILHVAADGFLYNMVRILTGTLIEVSEGKIKVDDIPLIISGKDRKMAGFTAPPQGLYLNKVVY